VAKMRFHFVTPVWGSSFVDLFVGVALPSQLTPRNIRGVAQASDCLYQIFTTTADAGRIRAHDSFRELERVVPVEVICIDDLFTDEVLAKSDWFIRVMTACHRSALETAAKTGAGAFFLPPDMVYSEGTLTSAAEHMSAGKRAVLIPGVRLTEETFVPEILTHYDGSRGWLRLESRELVRIALKHLHPVSQSLFWNSAEFNVTPANVHWRVGDSGMLVRGFHLHPLLVRPLPGPVGAFESIDGVYLQDLRQTASEIYVGADSDEMLVFGLTSRSRVIGNFGSNRARLATLAVFVTHHANSLHRKLAQIPIRLHAEELSRSWKQVEFRSHLVLRSVLFGSALLGRLTVRARSMRVDVRIKRRRTVRISTVRIRTMRAQAAKQYRRRVIKPTRREVHHARKRLTRLRQRGWKQSVRRYAWLTLATDHSQRSFRKRVRDVRRQFRKRLKVARHRLRKAYSLTRLALHRRKEKYLFRAARLSRVLRGAPRRLEPGDPLDKREEHMSPKLPIVDQTRKGNR